MIKRATAGIIWKDGKILIARRQKDLFWEFPGGHIEVGETPEECLIREIKEELNIKIRIEKFLAKIEGFFRGKDIELHAFHVQWIEGKPELHVHSEIQWIEPRRMNEFLFVDEDREIVKIFSPLTKIRM
ncbi:MAG: (deoxy)nucleoside triphosphate pyrophosphohydrolase [Candidatus Omnitrophica bacterium]|nr:(deoxy)nucleoside triphosphate pyrophosphohydrolase [Candidatus Omnitrophota bacterium]